jgi:hypothetical protein
MSSHRRHVALVLGRVLHPEKEISAVAEVGELLRVRHVELRLARQHFLHVIEPCDEREALVHEDRIHAPQDGEHRLGILLGRPPLELLDELGEVRMQRGSALGDRVGEPGQLLLQSLDERHGASRGGEGRVT